MGTFNMASERYSFSLTTFSPSGKLVQSNMLWQQWQQEPHQSASKLRMESFWPLEEAQVDSVRRTQRSQDRDDHPQHRNGLQRYGTRLPTSGAPGQENGPAVLGHLPRADPYSSAGPTCRHSHAGVHTIGWCAAIWCFAPDVRLGQRPSLFIPMRSVWRLFCLESHSHGQELHQRQDFPGKRYNEDLELDDAVHTAILTLKEGFEGQMTEDNVEIGISNEQGFRRLSPAEVKDYLANIA